MLPASLYRVTNIGRIRYSFVAAASIAGLICGYFLVRMALEYQQLRSMEQELHRLQTSAIERSGQLRAAKQKVPELLLSEHGGTNLFAVRVSSLASARKVHLESLAPEGEPVTADITFEDKPIGQWTSNGVEIQGQGQFGLVIGFMEAIRQSGLPVQIESFSLQTLDEGKSGEVDFQLTLTVYEKVDEAA